LFSHLQSNQIRVLKHHGSSKAQEMEHLLQHDIVLTTYATLASEYQNEQSLLYETTWFRLVLDEGIFHQEPFL
jgi:SWI/SNF-related matrix-associated actin-dependent regulator of chromatin subfamily A3